MDGYTVTENKIPTEDGWVGDVTAQAFQKLRRFPPKAISGRKRNGGWGQSGTRDQTAWYRNPEPEEQEHLEPYLFLDEDLGFQLPPSPPLMQTDPVDESALTPTEFESPVLPVAPSSPLTPTELESPAELAVQATAEPCLADRSVFDIFG
jgi:hypothetical protein